MRVETIRAYIELAELHGWVPSWDGLRAFAEQEKMRELWRK